MIAEVKGKPQELQNRLIDFAVRIISVIEALRKKKAGQLVRLGTSSAPNDGEAQSAESRKDFYSQDEGRSQGTSRELGLVENR